MLITELRYASIRRADVGAGAIGGFTCDIASPYAQSLRPAAATPLALCRQTHSDNIAIVDRADTYPDDTDALITRVPGLAVGVRTADCVPVLLNAPDIGAVAAVHAGWRGTLARIAAKTVDRLRQLGADPGKMHAFVGACICAECYEVSPELGDSFRDAGFAAHVSRSPGSRPHLDLRAINRSILLESGIAVDRIVVSDVCTRHTTADGKYLLPSYRREQERAGRLVTFIMMPPESL